MMRVLWVVTLASLMSLAACTKHEAAPSASASTPEAKGAAEATTSPAPPAPVALPGTEALEVVADDSGRTYPVWVSLPASYVEGDRRYPVVFVTDGLYSFPMVRSIRNLLGQKDRNIEDFILVGLPPQKDLSSLQSRSRDYTPSNPKLRPNADPDDYSGETYGEAATYRDFIQQQIFPLIASRYRADMQRKIFAGHSYGGLFGSFVLFTKPTMFQSYILSSPSLWFDKHEILKYEQAWAVEHKDLPARVMLYNGSFETIKPAPRYFRTYDMIGDTQSLERTLKSRHYPSLEIGSHVLADEDHLTVFPNAISRGLLWALPGRGPYTSG